MLSDGTAARARGSRGRLRRDLTGALNDDLREHGGTVIAWLRKEKPVEYCKLILSLIPTETEAERSPFGDVSNDELCEMVEVLRERMRNPPSEASAATGTPPAEPAPPAT